MKKESYTIISAEYVSDYILSITFSDGFTKTVDFEPFIFGNPPGACERYQNVRHFKEFRIEDGNVCWANDMDFDPAKLRKLSKVPARKPLSASEQKELEAFLKQNAA